MAAQAEINTLIIGGGGREDALAKIFRRQSPRVGNIYIAPGNGGTERIPNTQGLNLDPRNFKQVYEAVKDNQVVYVLIGPEEPLVMGLADFLRQKDILTFGPGKEGAALEGSKIYALEFMKEFDISHPNSRYSDNYTQAKEILKEMWSINGIVIKADGLCAGKGVYVCNRMEEAEEALEDMMVKKVFDRAGEKVVIQEKLEGWELSAMAIVANKHHILLPFSEDHKQFLDDDKGPNTGGMGVLAPHPLVTSELKKTIIYDVINRTMTGIKQRKIDFRGVLYWGLMITPQGVKLLEFNVRFGDPEIEGFSPSLKGDFYEATFEASQGKIYMNTEFPTEKGYCTTVALASEGYPGQVIKGREIFGLDNTYGKDVTIYHAGTKKENGKIVTSAGRVVMVARLGQTIEESREVYKAIGEDGIHFEGMQYRKDIGARRRK